MGDTLISLKDLGMLILFLLSSGVLVLLILFLLKAIRATRRLDGFLREQAPRVDQVIKSLPSLIAHVDKASENAGEVAASVNSLVSGAADALTGQAEQSSFLSQVGSIAELVKSVINLFSAKGED
ncbi:MAG TPA: hypothetical protein DD727_04325 [Clostridiales bacterium]|nr:hypothetical protein [Clostridiales bacterium]